MSLKKIIIPFLLCLFLVGSVKATTWQTVASGSWNNGFVWLGGIAPSYTSADTFLIRNSIIIDSPLNFNTGAYLEIYSSGSICGHEKLTTYPGTTAIVYGVLQLDTLHVDGGDFYGYGADAYILLTYWGTISNGGTFTSNCEMEVGPWFECKAPEITHVDEMEGMTTEPKFSIYPNPFSSSATISSNSILKNATLSVYNSSGKIVKEIQNISGETITFSRNDLPIGLYYFQLIENNKTIFSDKLIIVDD